MPLKRPEKQIENRRADGTFAPGVSGNPNGRPRKGQAINDVLREKLDEAGEDGRTRRERIIEALLDRAEGGDLQAIRWLIERLEPSGAPQPTAEDWADDAEVVPNITSPFVRPEQHAVFMVGRDPGLLTNDQIEAARAELERLKAER